MVVLAEKQKDQKIPRSLKHRGISRFCPFLPVRRPLWAADGPSGFLRKGVWGKPLFLLKEGFPPASPQRHPFSLSLASSIEACTAAGAGPPGIERPSTQALRLMAS